MTRTPPDPRPQTRDPRLGPLNRNAAAALLLLALTFLFYPSEEGMAWMMWRDAPLLAGAMTVAGLWFGRRWLRLQRSVRA